MNIAYCSVNHMDVLNLRLGADPLFMSRYCIHMTMSYDHMTVGLSCVHAHVIAFPGKW